MQQAAKHGSEAAIRRLASVPVCPEEMEYLVDWARQLYGRSGVGFGGFAPLSYSTIASWADLTRYRPGPHEVEALIVLDGAMMATEPDEEDEAPARQAPAWPTRKQGA